MNVLFCCLEELHNVTQIISLVWFYGISTLLGYLMPNSLNIYVLNMYDLLTHSVDNVFKWA